MFYNYVGCYMNKKEDEKHLFIYTLKLKTSQQDRERLNKRFRMAQDIYRKALIEVHKRYLKLKKDPLYKKAIKLDKGDKEKTALFKELREKINCKENLHLVNSQMITEILVTIHLIFPLTLLSS